MSSNNTFRSDVFDDRIQTVEIGDGVESILPGYKDSGERNLSGVEEVFRGIGQLTIIGWSSQGPAWAQNLRETLKESGLDTKVVVGLREGSDSRAKAEGAGFNEADGTLMTPEDAIKSGDVVSYLVSDAAMAAKGLDWMNMQKPKSTAVLAHGFFLGHLQNQGEQLPPNIDVIGICPKGMGPSVRRLYEQKSGINNSFAVVQGGDKARDLALGISVALGAPNTFQTTLDNERNSDLTGERAMLLGGVHGMVEALYRRRVASGIDPETAYLDVVESIVAPISETISKKGLVGLYDSLDEKGKQSFTNAYNATFPQLKPLIQKIYRDVKSGREVGEVIDDHNTNIPMTKVDGTPMWAVGKTVREKIKNGKLSPKVDPEVAGMYVAGLMAQVTTLVENGHAWSEAVNESIIEAVDSLNPYMRERGVAFMVDNCSETARRGSRKWCPQFDYWLSQGAFPVLDALNAGDKPEVDYFADTFTGSPVHGALSTLNGMRPPVSISVV